MQIDGVTLATTPGTFARLACGDTLLIEQVLAVGDEMACPECEARHLVVTALPVEIVPTVQL